MWFQATATLPGKLLEVQILRCHTRSPESVTLGVRPSCLCFSEPTGDSDSSISVLVFSCLICEIKLIMLYMPTDTAHIISDMKLLVTAPSWVLIDTVGGWVKVSYTSLWSCRDGETTFNSPLILKASPYLKR